MFLVYDKRFCANYHHQQHKLSILLRKIQCEWLKETLTFIRVAASSIPPTTTFEGAMVSLRCAVQARHPPQSGILPVRRIKAVDSKNGKGKPPWVPHGRGLHTNDKIVSLSDGGTAHFHPSYWFPGYIFRQLTEDQKQAGKDLRDKTKSAPKDNANHKRTIQQLETENLQLLRAAAATTTPPGQVNYPNSVSLDDQLSVITKSFLSQVTRVTEQADGASIMGGRNEQAFKKNKKN